MYIPFHSEPHRAGRAPVPRSAGCQVFWGYRPTRPGLCPERTVVFLGHVSCDMTVTVITKGRCPENAGVLIARGWKGLEWN